MKEKIEIRNYLNYIVCTVDIEDGNYVLHLSLYLLDSSFPKKFRILKNKLFSFS